MDPPNLAKIRMQVRKVLFAHLLSLIFRYTFMLLNFIMKINFPSVAILGNGQKKTNSPVWMYVVKP